MQDYIEKMYADIDNIKADNPELPAFETYEELLAAIQNAL